MLENSGEKEFIEAGQASKRLSPREILELHESRKQTREILDDEGKPLCDIDIDPVSQEIVEVRPKKFTNTEGKAEHPNEHIYVTDESGRITPERLTRQEARTTGKRYLIVTTLLFHGNNEMLVQKRSSEKEIDPGKSSSSAHGVAKELFAAGQQRITDERTAALVNAALETNEELRHQANPFTMRIWPGNHDALLNYAKENNLNDPDMIWVIPEAYLPDDAYPLGGTPHNPRSRALFTGMIFGQAEPLISIDPHELGGYQWQSLSNVFQDTQAADDLSRTTYAITEKTLMDSPLVKKYGPKMAENILRRYQGLEIDRP